MWQGRGMLRHVFHAGLAFAIGSAAMSSTAGASERKASAVKRPALETFRSMEEAYSVQRAALQQEYGQDVYVASYQGLVHEGQIVTFAIWTDTVPTVLPKTDFIWLQNAKMSRWFVVPWSEIESPAPLSKLDQPGPARYLTPARIPADFFAGLAEHYQPPKGFPERMASGQR